MSKTAYDQTPFLWLPAGWNDTWLKARAQAVAGSGSIASIGIIGDSIAAGQGASAFTKGWVSILRDRLSPLMAGLYGEYFPAYGAGGAGGLTNPPWSLAQNGVAEALYQGHGYDQKWFAGAATTAAAHQTFTFPYAANSIDILYEDINTGTWQYNVNGGGQQTVTNAATSNQKRISVAGPFASGSTFQYGWQSAANVANVDGIVLYSGQGGGLGIVRNASTGNRINYFNNFQAKFWQGCVTGGAQTASGTNTGFGFPMQPSLGILAIGLNDCSNNVDGAGVQGAIWKTNARLFIQAFRRGTPNASVLILAPNFPDAYNADQTAAWGANQANWGAYLEAMYAVAQSFNCAVVNMHAKWGELAVTNGFIANNDVHPTDAGHLDIANTLLGIL